MNNLYSEFIRKNMLHARDTVTIWCSHCNPNILTFIGLCCNAAAGILIFYAQFIAASIAIIAAGAMDILDGSVAKRFHKVTAFGAFWDSTLDRYSDIFLFLGIIGLYLKESNTLAVCFTLSALCGSLMVSYTRARAENMIKECKVGFWERPERIVYLILGLWNNNLTLVIIVLGICTHLTVFARILHTFITLMSAASSKSRPFSLQTLARRIILWEYPRYTLAYDIKVIILIILVIWVKIS